jgi:hypothetical protein
MKRLFWLSALLFTVVAAVAYGQAASMPSYGGGQIAVATTATAVPALYVGIAPRNGIGIMNLGPNDIFCGFTSTVTTLTGFPVKASGGYLGLTLGQNGSRGQVYCITSVLQVAPADTRWVEVY